jgi:hypothetical protein
MYILFPFKISLTFYLEFKFLEKKKWKSLFNIYFTRFELAPPEFFETNSFYQFPSHNIPINILERKFVPWFDFSCLSGLKALSKKLFRPKISRKAKSN